MSSTTPRLTIGVPVYNGQRFIRATLDSILAQTYTDFELIICDNASTDATGEICQEFANRDLRVRYVRNDHNLGPAPNYNKCFELARGELFKWAAADDLLAPTFVEKCVAALDANPTAFSAYTRTILIDDRGNEVGKYACDVDLDCNSPARRFCRMVFCNHRVHNAHEFWGVMRSELLRKTPLKGSFPSADRVLMSWWTLLGKMVRVEEYLFYNREHDQRSQRAIANKQFRPGSWLSQHVGGGPTPPYEWWDAKYKGKIVFPEWRWVAEYTRAAWETKLPIAQKLAALAVCAGIWTKFIPRLGRDVLIAGELWLKRALGANSMPAASVKPSDSNSTARG